MPPTQTSSTTWAIISCCCLALGLAVGYVIFGNRPAPRTTAPLAAPAAPVATLPQPALVDEQQIQTLRSILARDPKNAQAAIQLGNLLYDAGRYPEAVPAYQQAFALDPANVHVSTDLGTALWYAGRADDALAQYARSLAIDATHAQTLFNLGIVRRDGKQDAAGAIRAWEQLLAAHPTYGDRLKVEQLLADARQRLAVTPPLAPVRSGR